MGSEDGRKSGEETPNSDFSRKKDESSYHHGNLRNALIQAGLEILRTGGVQQLSLREAARAAGVSQAAPYRHFKNKQALLAAVAQEGFALLGELIHHATQPHRNNPEEQFHQAALAYLKLATEHSDHFRLMFGEMAPIRAEEHPDLDRVTQELFQELVAVIQRCQRERVLRNGNSEQLALVAWSSFHGFTSLLVNHNLRFLSIPQSQTELAMRALTRNLLEGLAPT
jgi:AcrR family transcriptional regulator